MVHVIPQVNYFQSRLVPNGEPVHTYNSFVEECIETGRRAIYIIVIYLGSNYVLCGIRHELR